MGSPLSLVAVGFALGAVAGTLRAEPPLHLAVHEDRTEEAIALLEGGADPSAANAYEVTPLQLACVNGNGKLVGALIGAGADPDAEGVGGVRPLHLAARSGYPEPIRELLSAGAEVNATDRRGHTPLMWAAAEGHAVAVGILIESDADRSPRLGSGFTAFLFAARQGHGEVVERFLVDGADPDAAIQVKDAGGRRPVNGVSALRLAIENGHYEVGQMLLEDGADPNDLRSGYAPLHVLSWVRKPRRGDGIDGAPPPRGSGAMTSLQFIDALVTHGADVDLRIEEPGKGNRRLDHHGATPFLLASRTADLPFMRRLLEHGADPLIANRMERDPLLAAAGVALGAEADEAATEDEAVAAVSFLLDELGADLSVADKDGNTVMHAAAFKQSPKLVHLLVDKGADIDVWNVKNRQGWTPLLISQGFRNGNFKPSAPTEAALGEVMRAAGVEPPAAPAPPE